MRFGSALGPNYSARDAVYDLVSFRNGLANVFLPNAMNNWTYMVVYELYQKHTLVSTKPDVCHQIYPIDLFMNRRYSLPLKYINTAQLSKHNMKQFARRS